MIKYYEEGRAYVAAFMVYLYLLIVEHVRCSFIMVHGLMTHENRMSDEATACKGRMGRMSQNVAPSRSI